MSKHQEINKLLEDHIIKSKKHMNEVRLNSYIQLLNDLRSFYSEDEFLSILNGLEYGGFGSYDKLKELGIN